MTEPRVVVLVPRREGKPDRDATWRWVKRWWTENLGWPIVEGHHEGGLFNRAAALNTAREKAGGEFDVAVIIDADMLAHPPTIREAAELALEDGRMVLPFTVRHDLDQRMSAKIQSAGSYRGSWMPGVHRSHHSMCSGIVAVPLALWDAAGGFDPVFEGWGWEDNAFAAAVETFAGRPALCLPGEAWHLWHVTARDPASSRYRNQAIADLYIAAKGDPEAIRAVRAQMPQTIGHQRIPRTIHRVVPKRVDPRAERWWQRFRDLHPGWALETWRDPLDPSHFPLTSHKWADAENGAQLADMVRLEVLLRYGGIYVDEDVQPIRSMAPLLQVAAFAAWEDRRVVPNAVMGAVPWHPAVQDAMNVMLARIPGPTWEAGPGVTTEVFVGRDDVLLLPPESFYAVHYRDPQRDAKMRDFRPEDHPAAFALHHYAGSWLKK